jgi:putative two-component system response regulator
MGVQLLDRISTQRTLPRSALRKVEPAEAATGQRPLVIVAPAHLSLLRSLLGDVECDVEIGLDGNNVLDLVQQRNPALLLLGADAPGMDGFKVCQLVKSAPVTRRLPVLIVTSRASADDQQRALDAGADDVLTTPISRVELLARVRSHLRLKQLSDRLNQTEATLFAMAAEAEARSGQPTLHTERVAVTSRALGEHLGLPAGSCELLYKGGRLHDIGMLGVPETVLRKAAALSRAESQLMRQHPLLGDTMLILPPDADGLRSIARHHHERYDGRGYPDMLKGQAIPLPARVVAVCDAYDALLNDRPHRKRLTPHEAIAMLKRGGGRQWDRELVAAFVRHVAPLQTELRAREGQAPEI